MFGFRYFKLYSFCRLICCGLIQYITYVSYLRTIRYCFVCGLWLSPDEIISHGGSEIFLKDPFLCKAPEGAVSAPLSSNLTLQNEAWVSTEETQKLYMLTFFIGMNVILLRLFFTVYLYNCNSLTNGIINLSTVF